MISLVELDNREYPILSFPGYICSVFLGIWIVLILNWFIILNFILICVKSQGSRYFSLGRKYIKAYIFLNSSPQFHFIFFSLLNVYYLRFLRFSGIIMRYLSININIDFVFHLTFSLMKSISILLIIYYILGVRFRV